MRSISIQLPPVKRILDVGCGTGWVLAEAHCDSNPCRVGIDISQDALDSAATTFPHLRLVRGSGVELPFASESFDVVIGHVAAPYMDTRLALKEIYRVLAPGGTFLVTFHSLYYARQRFMKSIRIRQWKDLPFCVYLVLNGWLNHFGLPQARAWWSHRFETVNTPAGVCRTARAVGFATTAAEHVEQKIFFAVMGLKPNPNGNPALATPRWPGPLPGDGGAVERLQSAHRR